MFDFHLLFFTWCIRAQASFLIYISTSLVFIPQLRQATLVFFHRNRTRTYIHFNVLTATYTLRNRDDDLPAVWCTNIKQCTSRHTWWYANQKYPFGNTVSIGIVRLN